MNLFCRKKKFGEILIEKGLATKEQVEQSLADTVEHGREVTKSQVSGSRQHSQKAEDEMADMLKSK